MITAEELKKMTRDEVLVISCAFLIVWACGFFWGRLTA
jgi:hypothetical protein